MNDLINELSKTKVSSGADGVSFKGKGLKMDSESDCADVIAAIKSCPNLTYLDLEGNTLGIDAARAIAEALKTKKELKNALWKDLFTGRMRSEIPKALAFLGNGLTVAGATLRELDLSDNAFGPIAVEALDKLLRSSVCFQLEILRFNNNGLGSSGGELLAKALLECYSNSLAAGSPFALKVFIAGRNRLEDKGATALSQVFERLGSLEEIQMPQNGIFYRGITKISESLQSNPNLRVLNLNDNLLTPKGALAVAHALPQLQKLVTLNLGDCLLKNKGAMFIAGALSEGHNDLEEVYFDANEIKPDGAFALIRALKNKPQIKGINMTDNSLGKKTRIALENELKTTFKSDILHCSSGEDDDDGEEETNDEEEEESESDEEEEEDDNEDDDDDDSDNDDTPIKKESTMEDVAEIISAITLVDNSPIGTFLKCPSADNFLKLQDMSVDNVFEYFKGDSKEVNVESFLELIMKISNLASNKDESIRKRSQSLGVSLYKTLFEWANDGQISAVNNCLFVYLALIKNEDNLVRINWDVEQCIKVLQKAVDEKIVPSFTQHILQCCLERKSNKKKVTEIIVS